MNNHFVYIFILLILSCQVKKVEEIGEFHTLAIDFSSEAKELSFSDFIYPEIEVIPLDNLGDNSELIFINSIRKLQMHENELFLFDMIYSQKVIVFDRKGNYLRSIGRAGEGPGEYLQSIDFLIDKNEVHILDVSKVLTYNLNGEYLYSNKLGSFMSNGFSKFDSGYAFVGAGRGSDNLLLSDNDFELQKSYFPYHTRALNSLLINPMYNNPDGELVYRRKFNDTLFRIEKYKRPTPYLFVDFGSKRVDLNKLLNSPDPEIAIKTEGTKYCSILYFYESPKFQYLAFTLEGEKWINIHSIETGKSILFKNSNLNDDVTFVPYSSLIGVSGETFFFKVSHEQLISSIQSFGADDGLANHQRVLKVVASQLDKEDNPVLVGIRFKF